MKKSIILSVAIILTACVGLQFDNLEFDRFITMKEIAQQGVLTCGKPEVKAYVTRMTEIMRHQNLYSMNRPTRNDIRIATQKLTDIIETMNSRYSRSSTPSIAYCQQKFENISSGSSTIISTIGKL